jgi:hypothetical protein
MATTMHYMIEQSEDLTWRRSITSPVGALHVLRTGQHTASCLIPTPRTYAPGTHLLKMKAMNRKLQLFIISFTFYLKAVVSYAALALKNFLVLIVPDTCTCCHLSNGVYYVHQYQFLENLV